MNTDAKPITPAQAAQRIAAVDAIIQDLRAKRDALTDRVDRKQLMNQIDGNLDERLRLMALRDGHPFSAGTPASLKAAA